MSQLQHDGSFANYTAPEGWERCGGFAVDQTGRFCINIAGIGVFDPSTRSFGERLFDDGFETQGNTSVDSAGRFLMPAAGGLVRFDPIRNTREILTFSNPEDFLSALSVFAFEDRAGALWVGTRGGLYRSDPNRKAFLHLEHSKGDPGTLNSNQVSAVLEASSGAIWVGTFGGGLHRIDSDGNLHRLQHDPSDPQSLCHDIVWDLAEDKDGNLWIAHELGLCTYDPEAAAFSLVQNLDFQAASGLDHRITAVLVGPDDRLWLGSGFGLLRFDPATGATRPVRMPAGEGPYCDINSLVMGRGNALWVAGGDACSRLYTLDVDDRQSDFVLEAVSGVDLESEGVFDLVEDDFGVAWIATVTGLGRFDPRAGTYDVFTTLDGLPGSTVYSVLADDLGNFWLGTNRGLSRFDPGQSGAAAFRNFHLQDGIGSVEFNRHAALAASDGRFYFGGMGGLTVFSPQGIRDNPVIPPVVLTGIRVWGRDGSREVISHGCNELRLNHDENSFEIRFAALNFTNAEDNEFRYQLHGHDLVEIHSGAIGFARYTQVRPGHYRFQVKGSNNDNLWNEAGASVSIIIAPPFWQSWWGRGLFAVILVAMVFGAHRYRVARLLEVERLRWRIAADLHDDLSSDLSGIALAASLLGRRGLSSTNETERLSEIERTSRSMVERLRDVVWCVNPEHDSLNAVVRRMRTVAGTLLPDIPCEFNVDLPPHDPVLAMSDRRNLILIFKEALHNITRHAAASRVGILLRVRDQVLTLEISDDGTGFATTAKSSGHGLANLRRRASEMGADLDISSTPGHGTRLTLVLKMTRTRGGQTWIPALPWLER